MAPKFFYYGIFTNSLTVISRVLCRKKTFLLLFLSSNQYRAGRFYDLCVYFMTRAPEGSTENGSGEAGNRTCVVRPLVYKAYSTNPLTPCRKPLKLNVVMEDSDELVINNERKLINFECLV